VDRKIPQAQRTTSLQAWTNRNIRALLGYQEGRKIPQGTRALQALKNRNIRALLGHGEGRKIQTGWDLEEIWLCGQNEKNQIGKSRVK
jgi:hypothetical protein